MWRDRFADPALAGRVEAVRLSAAPKGLPGSDMAERQQARLRALLDVYIGRIPDELPGGRVEPGEEDRQAVRRECLEELGVSVVPGDRVGPDVPIGDDLVLRVYRAELDPPEAVPHPQEHRALCWLTAATLGTVEWLPAEGLLLPALRRILGGGA